MNRLETLQTTLEVERGAFDQLSIRCAKILCSQTKFSPVDMSYLMARNTAQARILVLEEMVAREKQLQER